MRTCTWGPLALLWIGCQDLPVVTARDHAIVDGEPSERDPGVVAIVRDDRTRCSGTVIAPRLVVTAAHCIRDELPEVRVGADPSAPEQRVAVAGQIVHPSYGEPGSLVDVALLVLVEPIAVAPVRVAAPGAPRAAGDALRVVGFGHTGPESAGELVRRTGGVQITAITGEAMFAAAAPSQICHGDSGGAAFALDDGHEVLAGVISDVDVGCEGESLLVRTDGAAHDFIARWMDAVAPGGSAAGERCWVDDSCAAGSCVAALDEPALRFCGTPCASDDACPVALACDAGLCRHPLPSPGAAGSACAADRDCAAGHCLAVGEDGATVCAQRCVPGGETCGDGAACVATAGGGDYGCVTPRATGGCNSARDLRVAFVGLVLLVLLFLHRGRSAG